MDPDEVARTAQRHMDEAAQYRHEVFAASQDTRRVPPQAPTWALGLGCFADQPTPLSAVDKNRLRVEIASALRRAWRPRHGSGGIDPTVRAGMDEVMAALEPYFAPPTPGRSKLRETLEDLEEAINDILEVAEAHTCGDDDADAKLANTYGHASMLIRRIGRLL